MEDWPSPPNRGTIYEHSFVHGLELIGIPQRDYDEIAPLIDEVLRGLSDEVLEATYPRLHGNLRLIFTDQAIDVPPLRIAFTVDHDDHGKICYHHVDHRDAGF